MIIDRLNVPRCDSQIGKAFSSTCKCPTCCVNLHISFGNPRKIFSPLPELSFLAGGDMVVFNFNL